MKLVYPAIFYPNEEQGGYTVEVPDLPGCVSCGRDLAEAILMGQEAAAGWVLDELEEELPVPKASETSAIVPEKGGFVSLLALDMDTYIQKYGSRAVRKNLTIPAWLNTFAEKEKLNISQVLQNALFELYKQSTQC